MLAKATTIIQDEEEQTVPLSQPLGLEAPEWTSIIPVAAKPQQKFSIDGPHVIPDDQPTTNIVEPTFKHSKEGKISPTEELLKYHQKMGHISFAKLQIMAKEGALPKHLAKCEIPICTSCMYAKMAKRPWRNKPTTCVRVKSTPDPGEIVSVDQMVSPTAGFVAQLTGILTKKRYKYATVYVDQATRLGYIHLQTSPDAEETLKGKLAFEQMARNSGITIKGYHADNGIFCANAWVNDCNRLNQRLTFAGVNAHH